MELPTLLGKGKYSINLHALGLGFLGQKNISLRFYYFIPLCGSFTGSYNLRNFKESLKVGSCCQGMAIT